MGIYKQLGDVEVEAFQWRGDNPAFDLPYPAWTNGMALHTPSDNTLHVPVGGVNPVTGLSSAAAQVANINDWVVRSPDGTISVMPDSQFSLYFDVEAGNIEALKAQQASDADQQKAREDAFVKATTPSAKEKAAVDAKAKA
jgi:hypothetical protein